MYLVYEVQHVVEGSEQRVDVLKVGDVVPVVSHRALLKKLHI